MKEKGSSILEEQREIPDFKQDLLEDVIVKTKAQAKYEEKYKQAIVKAPYQQVVKSVMDKDSK